MSYFDCFLTPVPRASRAQYEALARLSAEIVREHGALSVTECWLDEDGHGAIRRFISNTDGELACL